MKVADYYYRRLNCQGEPTVDIRPVTLDKVSRIKETRVLFLKHCNKDSLTRKQ